MPRRQFSIRTMFWLTLIMAAIAAIAGRAPAGSRIDALLGSAILATSMAGSFLLLSGAVPTNAETQTPAWVVCTALAMAGAFMLLDAFQQPR